MTQTRKIPISVGGFTPLGRLVAFKNIPDIFVGRALLDETASLSCMADVDLNLVRAALEKALESSGFYLYSAALIRLC